MNERQELKQQDDVIVIGALGVTVTASVKCPYKVKMKEVG
jgi:hypothetical protein